MEKSQDSEVGPSKGKVLVGEPRGVDSDLFNIQRKARNFRQCYRRRTFKSKPIYSLD